MDPVAEFFVHNIIVVYFFYGLAFFCMGLVVWLESGRTSEFRIARAIGALAAFGILHGLHEWFEMFQKLSETGATNIPGWLLLDPIRISHLVLSFLLLVVFGVRLLYAIHRKDGNERRVAYLSAGALLIVWGTAVLLTRWLYNPSPDEFVAMIDVLSRYMIGMPGALLAAWAIILEQRSFRKRGMTGFGRDLLWAASALLLYGIVPELEAQTRDYKLTEGEFLSDNLDKREIVLVETYADDEDISTGDRISLVTPQGTEKLIVIGLIAREGPGQTNSGAFGVIPYETA
ncbi:MAG: hypothetical protein ACWGPS_04705, partial [Candidatus Promineifilaceae bacterium]